MVLNTEDPDNIIGVLSLLGFICVVFALGVVCGYYAGYEQCLRDQLVDIIIKGIK